MKQIISFFSKRKDFFVFLILSITSFVFILNANSYQKTRYFHSANALTGDIFLMENNLGKYFDLKYQNQLLTEENKNLREQLFSIQRQKAKELNNEKFITLSQTKYSVFRAEVIKNNIHFSKNYLLINKGEKHGIQGDMGVISSKGIVGIIDKTTQRFSSVQSILNTLTSLSASLKKTGHYGSLRWENGQTNIVQLIDIPSVAKVKVGDSVVTDSRSSIFPKGIPIGKVKKVNKNRIDNSLSLDVELFTDMSNLQYVYIIKNEEKKAIKEIEKIIENSTENE